MTKRKDPDSTKPKKHFLKREDGRVLEDRLRDDKDKIAVERMTLTELATHYEALLGFKINPSNIRSAFRTMKLTPPKSRRATGKPGTLVDIRRRMQRLERMLLALYVLSNASQDELPALTADVARDNTQPVLPAVRVPT